MSGQSAPPAQQHAQQAAPPWFWWSRQFPGTPAQVADTRHWIRNLLPGCDPLDDLVEIASELATNAVTHTRSGLRGRSFSVQVAWSAGHVRVVVGDEGSESEPAVTADAAPAGILALESSDTEPADTFHLESLDMAQADIAALESLALRAQREHGRGLFIVGMLSAAWGICGGKDGRWVWADVPWESGGGVPLREPASGTPTGLELAVLRRAFPGSRIWFGGETRTWWALPPKSESLVGAPSPAALHQMLSLACSRRPAPAGPGQPRPAALAGPVVGALRAGQQVASQRGRTGHP